MVEDICGMALTHNVAYQGAYGDLHPLALIIAGCYVLVALLLSFFLILQHLRSYTKPSEQKWIVAVVFMVPVYASESIISLWNSRLSLALNILRDCYEAFALYSFGSYLVACLGGEEKVIELLEQESRKQLTKPLLENEQGVVQEQSVLNFFLRPRSLGKDSYSIVKFGLVQYMILKTVCSFLALFLELFGVYGDGEFKWNCGYPYIAVVMNFSQMWALYCLVQFYNVTHERLQPIKPLAKFISIKAIVFATWWQGVGIKLLCAIGVLPKEEKFQNGLQDFLICLEMAIAAVAHIFVFSAKPYHYLPLSEHGKLTVEATKDMVALEEECAVLEGNETHVKAPGTSVTGSVQDIVIEGGQNVVKDVVLTINQAIEPMGKGVTKMQETLQHISASPNAKAVGSDLGVEEHLETRVTESKSHVSSSG